MPVRHKEFKFIEGCKIQGHKRNHGLRAHLTPQQPLALGGIGKESCRGSTDFSFDTVQLLSELILASKSGSP